MAAWPFGIWLQLAISALSNRVKKTMDEIRNGTLALKINCMPDIQDMYVNEAGLQDYECTVSNESGCEWEFLLVDPNNRNNPVVDAVYTSIYNDLKDYEDKDENLMDVAIDQNSTYPKQFSVG